MFTMQSRILVVDDFEMVRLMLKRCLNELGYNSVDEATDGKHALQLIEASEGKPYDLIFADLNMPNINGLELLTACRMDNRFKAIPFVMVTAEAERQYVVQALQLGATDYVVKPFSQATLQKKIEKISERLKAAA